MSKVEYFVGGGGDKKDFLSKIAGSSNIMKAVSVNRKNTSKGIICKYRGHEQEDAILAEIKKEWKTGNYTSIRLTGHSWGGQAVMDLAQELFKLKIPVDELVTLDPVSMFPFGKVYASKWVNIHIKQSLIDNTVGMVPVIGNIFSAFITLPTLLSKTGASGGGYIANVGGQLGNENGAHNVELDVSHANAQAMYSKARNAKGSH